MNVRAYFVFCGLALWPGDDGAVLQQLRALASTSPWERADAASALRTGLKPADLGSVGEILKSATPGQRAAITGVLLDRRDLALPYIQSLEATDPFVKELIAAAWLRVHKNAVEPVLPARETVNLLIDNLGDSRFVECLVDKLDIDDLAYEVGRARLLAYEFIVDPRCESRTIPLIKAVANVESLSLDSVLSQNIPLYGCGAERGGDRTLPTALIAGAGSGQRPMELAAYWYETASKGNITEASRGGAALLKMRVEPFDAAVVGFLANPSEPRADGAFRAIISVPARGAALLCGDPRALDGFLTKASSAPLDAKTTRVLDALAKRDAAGRDVDGILLNLLKSAPQAARAGLLTSLARRRAKSAAPAFLEFVNSDDGAVKEACLRGLHALSDPGAAAAALATLQKSADGRSLAMAARILASREEAREAVLPILASLRGAALARACGVLLNSTKTDSLAAAVDAASKLNDLASLQIAAEAARDAVARGNRAALRTAFDAGDRENRSLAILRAFAGLAERPSDALARRIIDNAPPELELLAYESAGMCGSSEFVKKTVINSLRTVKLNVLGTMLGAHLFTLERSERSPFLDLFLDGNTTILDDPVSDQTPPQSRPSSTPPPKQRPPLQLTLDDIATLLSVAGRPAYINGNPGKSQVGVNLDRARPFPAPDEP